MRHVVVGTLAPSLLALGSLAVAAQTGPTAADLAYLKTVGSSLNDKDVAALAELTYLELTGDIDDAGLEHLTRLTRLESLIIRKANGRS